MVVPRGGSQGGEVGVSPGGKPGWGSYFPGWGTRVGKLFPRVGNQGGEPMILLDSIPCDSKVEPFLGVVPFWCLG